MIEPLENEEGVALHMLAIAVDVSGSCSSERVMEQFWGETYGCIEQVRDWIKEGEILLLQ